MMKSWRFHEFGSLDNLRLEDIPVPEPQHNEALIRLEFAALNPADAYLIRGKYPRAGTPPFAVGRDGCGVIERCPEGRFKPGDRVVILRSDIGVTREGTLAEYVCVPEDSLAPLPHGWSPEEGAAGPLVFLTAWQALVTKGDIASGKTVLVDGASGGVGTAAVMLAHAYGARVIALSRDAKKRRRLVELGAHAALDTADPGLEKQVKEALGGGRADIVIENLAGPYLQKSINLAAEQGRIMIVGLLAGLSGCADRPRPNTTGNRSSSGWTVSTSVRWWIEFFRCWKYRARLVIWRADRWGKWWWMSAIPAGGNRGNAE
ncbi:MAG: zinc-binding dehydrogenase [Candidatus Hydrogenedentes bacterium]|nr:zinc-binding dehydrogenase [Candidatus Hydrogenedentota bacterium]